MLHRQHQHVLVVDGALVQRQVAVLAWGDCGRGIFGICRRRFKICWSLMAPLPSAR